MTSNRSTIGKRFEILDKKVKSINVLPFKRGDIRFKLYGECDRIDCFTYKDYYGNIKMKCEKQDDNKFWNYVIYSINRGLFRFNDKFTLESYNMQLYDVELTTECLLHEFDKN